MWKYYQVIIEGASVLCIIALGAIAVGFDVIRATQIEGLNAFVFKFLLPAVVIRTLGIKTDLYDGAIWRFVGAFFLLRIATFALALLAALGRRVWTRKHNERSPVWLGEMLVDWLGLSWISTIVLGLPLLTVVLGPTSAVYPIYASISSFIFQLPVMLCLFELHTWFCERHALPEVNGGGQHIQPDVEAPASASTSGIDNQLDGGPKESADCNQIAKKQGTSASDHGNPAFRQRLAKAWSSKLLHNPVLWAVLIGVVLSLSKLGPTYLDPGTPKKPNTDFVKQLGSIDMILEWLSQCVTPVALFATGMWMMANHALFGAWRKSQPPEAWQARRSSELHSWARSGVLLLLKFTVVPLLMIPLAKLVGLEDGPSRAAVLIAALPIAPAAFTLGHQYGIGQSTLVKCIALGTILVIPTIAVFLEVMDAVDLFVVHKVALPAGGPAGAAPPLTR